MNVGWQRLIPLGMSAALANAVVGMLKRRGTACRRPDRSQPLENHAPVTQPGVIQFHRDLAEALR